jgi:hypothetical protein
VDHVAQWDVSSEQRPVVVGVDGSASTDAALL